MPFPFRDEIKNLEDETRKVAGCSYIQLPDGITHYELSSDHSSPKREELEVGVIVLIHGFSVPNFIFDPTFEFLKQSGFRVLRYDHFGRGFSDRPHARYNMDFFVKQLYDLLDALRLTNPVNLIGLSMGGPITATFTARYPERVKSMTLIDPTGVRPISFTPMLRLAKIPIVAEAVFGWMGSESMIQAAVNDFFDPQLADHFIGKYRVQMQYKGFKGALLSSIRNNMLDEFVKSYDQVGKMDKPVLLFWGRDDMTVPFEHSEDLRTAMPNAEFHAIENCGHIPHYEKPDEVNSILLKFLGKI